jgi:hypothetical protein
MEKDFQIPNFNAARFPDLPWACNQIYHRFSHCFPWMSLIYLIKDKNDNMIVNHVLSGPPIMSINMSNSRSIRIAGEWSNEDISSFTNQYKIKYGTVKKRSQKKITQAEIALYDDNDINIREKTKDFAAIEKENTTAWSKVRHVEKIVKAPKSYQTTFSIVLDNITHLDVYNWGFIIITDGPINLICIKNKFMKFSDTGGSNSDNPPYNDVVWATPGGVTPIVNTTFYTAGETINLPSENERQQMLCGYWDFNEDYVTTDDEIDKILSTKPSKTTDVGQHKLRYLDLD